MSDSKDYYKVLGVPKDASKEDIKRAYKRMAKKYHPDLNKEADAAERFKEINEAASILGDDQKRQQYDRFGPDAFKQGGGNPGGFDFSGFSRGFGGGFDFEDIFDTFFGGGGRRRGRARERGADIRYNLSLSLEEAAEGLEKDISLRKRVACKECGGQGGHDVHTCSTCHGTGAVRQTRQTPFGVFATTAVCPSCNGAGKSFGSRCDACDGVGVVSEKVELKVQVPAGVEDGVRLRLSSEGDAAPRGGDSGDLYLFIEVRPHKYFVREGPDLLLEVPISISQAALGDEVEVPTLFGKAKLKIPGGTQSETVFRLRGKGLPTIHSSQTGDQLVKVVVEVPKHLNAKQKEALEFYVKASGEGARPQKSLFKKIFG